GLTILSAGKFKQVVRSKIDWHKFGIQHLKMLGVVNLRRVVAMGSGRCEKEDNQVGRRNKTKVSGRSNQKTSEI
ncbi:hypothetical protein KI387_019962, partial [Taxus chinensis]